jgi:hypothetical protein
MHLLLKKNKKNHIFWMKFHLEHLNFYLIFNWCISISYIIKNSLNNSTLNHGSKVYMQFFQTLWRVLFCHKYISYIQDFHYLWY